MNKNVKRIFFVLTLVTLLIAVGTVSAADDTNSTTAVDNRVSDAALSDNDYVATEQVTTSNDKQVDTKTIKKEEKNLKTATKEVEVNNFNELTTTVNNAVNDGENDMYVINLNAGTYQMTANTNYNPGSYTPNIIINANNQSFTSKSTRHFWYMMNGCNITINDASINLKMQNNYNLTLNNVNILSTRTVNNYEDANLTLNNVTSAGIINNDGNLIISDDVIFTSTAKINRTGPIILNNTNIIYPIVNVFNGNSTLTNITLNKTITNNGNMILNNVTLDYKIINNNKLIIPDNCIITDNFRLSGNGEVITNFTFSENVHNTTCIVEVNTSSELNTFLDNNGIISRNDYYEIYIFNLNDGTYGGVSAVGNSNWYAFKSNIIINGNNQTLGGQTFRNGLNNTFNNGNITSVIVGGPGLFSSFPSTNLTLNNVVISGSITIYANGALTLCNCTVLSNIDNKGRLIIDDDTVIDPNVNITTTGTLITNNTNMMYPSQNTFSGGFLKDITIDKDITTSGNFTLRNVTIDKTITNNGRLVIEDDVIFTENGQIAGLGEIITNNITKILPYIQSINGNYTLTDTILNKSYYFDGNITLDNCNITSTDNVNYGILNIKNSNIIVDDEANLITNYGLLVIDNSNTSGNITNNRELYIDNLPEDYSYNNTYHVITNATAPLYFDSINGNVLNDKIQEGDTLDFQGTISGIPSLSSLVINKPVNIITSTNDGRIERFSSITYNNGASGSNITGIYTYNTQFYVRNANNMVFDNISNVVNSSAIGWGVGQTSIGHNSTNILVKNSYFYTKDNGGSSTFVFNWADNSTLVNSTVEADGNVGNLVYLTTYNVDIPSGTTANCNNQILNNTIRGPETALGICWAIVLSGNNNTVDGNTIHYVGTGITGQWGSGITGQGIDDNATSLVNNSNHKIFNNQLYTGTGFTGITGCILVNNTFYNNSRFRIGDDSLAINNTASNIEVMGKNSIIRNNNITNNQTYTMTGNGTNNTIKDNYLKALDKYGDESVNLNKERNTIANNTPKIELIIDTTTFTPGENTTIQAGIYFDGEIITDITKGKVTFKVDGKTLKDTNGKVIYAKIVNGTATIENYTVPYTWKEGSTIQAIYSGSTQCDKLTSEKTEITINKEAPTFTIDPIEPTAAGSTITLKATITDNNKVINTGKVVFKINGKTVKDANGKVIYAKVVNNEVIVEYTLPDSYKAKDYTVTAVLISPDYERLEDSKTLTVN